MRRTLLPWLLLAVAIVVFVAGRGHGTPSRGPVSARVLRVVDGDTIEVRLAGGRTDRVRYIGMDTPESVKPGVPVQCFAERASHFNERLVAGRTVTLRVGVEPRDRYGRLLAYVYAGPTFVNAELVRRGYARTLTIAPNDAYARRFAALERQARDARRGLWKVCA